MFMRGAMANEEHMEVHFVPVELEWKVDAVVDQGSKEFAAELQKLLNESTEQGFMVSNMMNRPDNALVIIQQRRMYRAPATDAPASESADKGKVAN